MNCSQPTSMSLTPTLPTQQFQTIHLSTLTASDLSRMNLLQSNHYISQRISSFPPPIKVQPLSRLRDINKKLEKHNDVYVNDNTSFVYKRPSICKVKVLQNEGKVRRNVEEIERSILLGCYERVGVGVIGLERTGDGKLMKSPKRHRGHRYSHSEKLDQMFDPIMISRKPYHMKYHIKGSSIENSYEKDLAKLKKRIGINQPRKLLDEFILATQFNQKQKQKQKEKQILTKDVQKQQQQSVQFEKYRPELVLPEIQSSRYEGISVGKGRKGKVDSKVFLYNTPWVGNDDQKQVIRHSFSQPKKHRL